MYEPLPRELLQAALDAVAQHGTITAAAKALNIPRETLSHRVRSARVRILGEPDKLEPLRSRRHLFIPDTQIRPGVPLDHISWIAQALVDYKPDVIVVAGDWFDMNSLNSHEEPGSEALEGARFKDDIDVGNAAFATLCAPMEREIERLRHTRHRWSPRKAFTAGNHENRADRVAQADPKWLGHVGSNHCNVRDFEWHPFLHPVEIDGVLYCHYFKMQNSKNAISGSADNRLNKIGRTHVQGHQVGFLYGNRVYPDGKTKHSLTAGSCYLHNESYRGPQCNKHFRGIVVLNEVNDGNFCLMPLSLNYLCRRYTGQPLQPYMQAKYPGETWDDLAE